MTAIFEKMLNDLQGEHNRQLSELHSQITKLKEEITQGKKSQILSASSTIHEDKPGIVFTESKGSQILASSSALPEDQTSTPTKFPTSPCSPPSLSPFEGERLESSKFDGRDTHLSHLEPVSLREARAVAQKGHEITWGLTPRKYAHINIEPRRFASLKDIVESPHFETIVAIAIAACALCNALEVQFVGMKRGYSLRVRGYGNEDNLWGVGVDVLNILDVVFTAVFIVEFLFRVIALRWSVFRSCWNWLDFLVVSSSVLDWTLGEAYNNTGSKSVRLLRILKAARLLKALKIYVSFFNILRLLLVSIHASLNTLFWTLIVIIGVQVICALVMTQSLDSYLSRDGDISKEEADKIRDVFLYFGTFSRSLISCFEILLANYAVPCRVLVNNVGEEYAFLIIAYRCIAGFSVLSVVQAVFLQQTMKIMSQDSELMLSEKGLSEDKYKKNLEALFRSLDMGGDGVITWNELSMTFNDERVITYCHALGLDPHDLEDIFHLVDEGTGIVINDFVTAAQQIRRQARTIDMARVLANERKIRIDLKALSEKVVQCLNFQRKSTTPDPVRTLVDAGSMTDTLQSGLTL